MLSFFVAVWAGAVLTVPCPYCHRRQTVARRPMPFAETCLHCRRVFRVTGRGVAAGRVGWRRPSPIVPSFLVAHRELFCPEGMTCN